MGGAAVAGQNTEVGVDGAGGGADLIADCGEADASVAVADEVVPEANERSGDVGVGAGAGAVEGDEECCRREGTGAGESCTEGGVASGGGGDEGDAAASWAMALPKPTDAVLESKVLLLTLTVPGCTSMPPPRRAHYSG